MSGTVVLGLKLPCWAGLACTCAELTERPSRSLSRPARTPGVVVDRHDVAVGAQSALTVTSEAPRAHAVVAGPRHRCRRDLQCCRRSRELIDLGRLRTKRSSPPLFPIRACLKSTSQLVRIWEREIER